MSVNQLYQYSCSKTSRGGKAICIYFGPGNPRQGWWPSILMQHLLSEAEINPPQDPIHLPHPGCQCQYSQAPCFPTAGFSKFEPCSNVLFHTCHSNLVLPPFLLQRELSPKQNTILCSFFPFPLPSNLCLPSTHPLCSPVQTRSQHNSCPQL